MNGPNDYSSRRWITYPNAVWCDVHVTHHRPNGNPYGVADERGRPIDECNRRNWRNLAILATPDETF